MDAIVEAERVCLQTCQARRQQQAKENFEKDESREDECVIKIATVKSITLDVEPWDKEVDLNEVEN